VKRASLERDSRKLAQELAKMQDPPAARRRNSSSARRNSAGGSPGGSAPPGTARRRLSSSRRRSSVNAQEVKAAAQGSSSRGASVEPLGRRDSCESRENSRSRKVAPRGNTFADTRWAGGMTAQSVAQARARDSPRGGGVFRLGAEGSSPGRRAAPSAPWDEEPRARAATAAGILQPQVAKDDFYQAAVGLSFGQAEAQDSDADLRFSPRSNGSDSPLAGTSQARVYALRKMMHSATGSGSRPKAQTMYQLSSAAHEQREQHWEREQPLGSPFRQPTTTRTTHAPMRSRASITDTQREPERSAASASSPPRRSSATSGTGQRGGRAVPSISSMPSAGQVPEQARSSFGGPTADWETGPGLDTTPAHVPAPAPAPLAIAAAVSAEVAAAEVAAAKAEAAAATVAAAMGATSPRASAHAPSLGFGSPLVGVAGASTQGVSHGIVASAGATAAQSPAVPAGRRRIYRVLTQGLGVRVSPDVNAQRTGIILRRGEIFEASVVAPGVDGRIYLKIAGARGWVFDDSAVDLNDPSVEQVAEEDLIAQQSARSGGTGAPHWALKQVDHTGRHPSMAWGDAQMLPLHTPAGPGGPGTPGRHVATPSWSGPHPPHLHLRGLDDVGGRPGSPRSCGGLGQPGPIANFHGPQGSAAGDPHAQMLSGHGHGIDLHFGHGHGQAGYASSAPSEMGGPRLSEEFREAMGGCAYPMARRRPPADGERPVVLAHERGYNPYEWRQI